MKIRRPLFASVVAGAMVAFAGFDRFDLLRGEGGFTLTPAVILSPLAVIAYLLTRFRDVEGERKSWVSGWPFLATSYLVVCALSVFTSTSADVSVRRFILLTLIVLGTGAAVATIRILEDPRLMRNAAWVGLVLAALITVLQAASWVSQGPGTEVWIGPIDVTSPTYQYFAPRPSGMSLDPNRGMLVVSLLVYMITVDPWSRQRNGIGWWVAILLGAAIVAASFSRTGMVLYAIVVIVAVASLRRPGALVLAIFFAFLATIFVPSLVTGSEFDIESLVRERLSFDSSDSGGVHFELYDYAFELIAERPEILIFGIGMGNSPSVLTGFYGVNPDANFHSYYLTALVETGILGFVLVVLMFLIPLLTRRRRTLAILLLGFNVFYQANLDAAYWVAVSVLWLLPTTTAHGSLPTIDGIGSFQTRGQMQDELRRVNQKVGLNS